MPPPRIGRSRIPDILITTEAGDAHALAVAHGLLRLGAEVAIWHGSDFPLQTTATFRIGRDAPLTWAAAGPELALEAADVRTVWYRRHCLPFAGDAVHPEDRRFVSRELRMFDSAMWNAIARNAFWVNPIGSHAAANSKLLQLELAREIGFAIPETLVSNDPEEIRRFVMHHERSGAIYKSFVPASWSLADGGRAVLPATEVSPASLPEPDALRLTPGIFQERIAKAYEIRAVFMGAEAVAAKIRGVDPDRPATDWRVELGRGLQLEPLTLPGDLHARCRSLMARLGIVFGCFDFIVTPAGETVFLEVNEMGQFLWMESALPDLPLLDMFCRFLLARRADFRYRQAGTRIAYADILAGGRLKTARERAKRLHTLRGTETR